MGRFSSVKAAKGMSQGGLYIIDNTAASFMLCRVLDPLDHGEHDLVALSGQKAFSAKGKSGFPETLPGRKKLHHGSDLTG